jgi:hypothetical protein
MLQEVGQVLDNGRGVRSEWYVKDMRFIYEDLARPLIQCEAELGCRLCGSGKKVSQLYSKDTMHCGVLGVY